MKDELLFAMLFFGFRRFPALFSFPVKTSKFPSPKAGADPSETGGFVLPETDVFPSLLGGASADARPSLGCSCILGWTPEFVLLFVAILYKSGGFARELRDNSEILVPAVAGCGVVARGFGLIIGASEGCGGGVARCRSSLRT
jgi:hypothetical protein